MTPEQHRNLNFLCSAPEHRHTTMSNEDLKQILLDTGGQAMACGRLWNIKSQYLAAGVYRVSLELWNP
jgi:hypothetical protein